MTETVDPFSYGMYYARKKFFKLFGGEIKIFDKSKQTLLFFVKQKAFKLKEDITVYADESKTRELLTIKARNIIDFSAAYDIVDARNGEKVGAIRRKGLKSLLRDSWEILNPNDEVIATVSEDSMAMAMVRRLFTNLVPQEFNILAGDMKVGHLKQAFNPFVPQFNINFTMDTEGVLDRRLGVGSVILLQIIEGRQQ